MSKCTCPSGDGSLRWPCPEHTPERTTCPACNGDGKILMHEQSCDDDLCALNGDMHSCLGVVVECYVCCGSGKVTPNSN